MTQSRPPNPRPNPKQRPTEFPLNTRPELGFEGELIPEIADHQQLLVDILPLVGAAHAHLACGATVDAEKDLKEVMSILKMSRTVRYFVQEPKEETS